MPVQMKFISALEKVFPEKQPCNYPASAPLSGMMNETLSLQLAYMSDSYFKEDLRLPVRIRVDCAVPCKVRQVTNVPVRLPCFADSEGPYLKREPGLYPDLLKPLTAQTRLRLYPHQWQALWLDILPDATTKAGHYTLNAEMFTEEGKVLAKASIGFEILPLSLPKQTALHTKWLHVDCIAQYYNVPMFSDEHFALLRSFIRSMVKGGINMVLTPIHTPPLDTRRDTYRPAAQLVKIIQTKEGYCFDFDLLKRFVTLCLEEGVEYFEMAHLFSQWGAEAAPQIVAEKDGKTERIFGWDTPALGDAYVAFLKAYLPALTQTLRELGIAEKSYFHISDEPHGDHIHQYLKLKALVGPMLEGFPIIDALSEISFYESGAVEHPIPAINHIDPFLAKEMPDLWTYYCVSQHSLVTNTFIAMPTDRTRILGVQMYKYKIKGFLQWAFNFYNAQYSDYTVNPYLDTDGDGFAPGGDTFQVYPGKDGEPEESIRYMASLHAMQDLRALQLAESRLGRDAVLRLIDEGLSEPLTLTNYPCDGEYLIKLRAKLHLMLCGG